MTPARQPHPHPHEKCHECPVFFKCEQLPPCATHTIAPAPHCLCVECSYSARSAKSCRHTLAGEDKRKIAKAAREQVLDALRKEISDRFHLKPRPYDPNDQEIPQIGIDELAEIFDAAEESLRSQQQEGGR